MCPNFFDCHLRVQFFYDAHRCQQRNLTLWVSDNKNVCWFIPGGHFLANNLPKKKILWKGDSMLFITMGGVVIPLHFHLYLKVWSGAPKFADHYDHHFPQNLTWTGCNGVNLSFSTNKSTFFLGGGIARHHHAHGRLLADLNSRPVAYASCQCAWRCAGKGPPAHGICPVDIAAVK